MTHGGQLSTVEALYHAGLPLFGDQLKKLHLYTKKKMWRSP